jgi:hypothetical protein
VLLTVPVFGLAAVPDEVTDDTMSPDVTVEHGEGLYATLDTVRGPIVLRLFSDRTPLAVANFVGLAEGTLNQTDPGVPFCDGLTFHRVVPGFIIQGGDPRGVGTGGPGYSFQDEYDPTPATTGPASSPWPTRARTATVPSSSSRCEPPRISTTFILFSERWFPASIMSRPSREGTASIPSGSSERDRKRRPSPWTQPPSSDFAASTPTIPRAQYLINKSQEDYPDGRVAWVNQKLFSHAQVTGRPIILVVMDNLGSDREAATNWEEMINDYGVREDGALILVTLDPRVIKLWIGENQLKSLPLPGNEPGGMEMSDHDRLQAAKQALLEPCYELLDTRAPQAEFRALMAALAAVIEVVDADLVEPEQQANDPAHP